MKRCKNNEKARTFIMVRLMTMSCGNMIRILRSEYGFGQKRIEKFIDETVQTVAYLSEETAELSIRKMMDTMKEETTIDLEKKYDSLLDSNWAKFNRKTNGNYGMKGHDYIDYIKMVVIATHYAAIYALRYLFKFGKKRLEYVMDGSLVLVDELPDGRNTVAGLIRDSYEVTKINVDETFRRVTKEWK